MERIKQGISILLLAGVLGVVGISSITSAYADEEEAGCGKCQCQMPNNPQGSQYGRMYSGDCVNCNCYILLE